MSAVATVEKPTDHGSDSSMKPSVGWVWLGSVIGVLGLTGAIVWGVMGVSGYLNRVNDLARVSVPGQLTVQLPAGEQFVYYEGRQGTASLGQLGIRVTDPHGRAVALEPYRLDLRYDHSGQVGRALATFQADAAGWYRVNAMGTAPAGSRIVVGGSVAKSVIATVSAILVDHVGTVA